MINKIFVSYRADDEGNKHKNLLVAWSNNDKFFPEIKFHDTSIGTSINSIDASYIKKVITQRIENSDALLCLIGENTGISKWVDWEIQKAYELNKPIYAIKIHKNYSTPPALYGKNAKWTFDFKKENIIKLLNS